MIKLNQKNTIHKRLRTKRKTKQPPTEELQTIQELPGETQMQKQTLEPQAKTLTRAHPYQRNNKPAPPIKMPIPALGLH